MAKLDVPPTKSQYLELRRNLDFAEQGFDLLEQKRTILTIELMGNLDAVRRMERDLLPMLSAAFESLREAALEAGSDSLERESFAALGNHEVDVRSRPLMGLALPVLDVSYKPAPPQFGALGTSARVDEVTKRFTEVLKLVGRLAELQNIIIRLARELRKTQRRVNALEKLFIPNYKDTIAYISEALEEREREGVVIMKMIKSRQTQAREAASTGG